MLKAGVWYLLARRRGEERVYRVSRIVSARERAESFTRPDGFDLAEKPGLPARRPSSGRCPRSRSPCACPPERDPVPARARGSSSDGDPATVVARFGGLDQAFHGLLAYGPYAEVLAPVELRTRIARAAAETAAIYQV